MITLIVSDVHCGDFKSGHRDLYSLLHSKPEVDRLIIAGDLFDLWVASSGRALKEGKYLLDYITERFGREIIYLTGNHDEDWSYLKHINTMQIKQFHKMVCKGKSIIICHGHQYDSSFYLNQAGGLAKFNAWLVNKTDKLFGIDTRKWLVSLSERIENNPYDKNLNQFKLNLVTEFKGIHDYVITGHTHCPKLDNKWMPCLLNCGDFVQHRTAILFDDNSGTFELVEYKDGKTSLLGLLAI
jgi:UDP-2,3-diacylglucosamine pyrophosphatase LpxH